MKNAKKFLVVALSVLMLATMFVTAASAVVWADLTPEQQAAELATFTHTFTVRMVDAEGNDVTTVNPGDTIYVKVDLDTWDGMFNLQYYVEFKNPASTDTETAPYFTPITYTTGFGTNKKTFWCDKETYNYLSSESAPFVMYGDAVSGQNYVRDWLYPTDTTTTYSAFALFTQTNNGLADVSYADMRDSGVDPADFSTCIGLYPLVVSDTIPSGTYNFNLVVKDSQGETRSLTASKAAVKTYFDIIAVNDSITIAGDCEHTDTTLVVDTAATFTTAGEGHYVCDDCGETVGESVTIPALAAPTSPATPAEKAEAAKAFVNANTSYVGASVRTTGGAEKVGVRNGYRVTKAAVDTLEGLGDTVEYGVVASLGFDPTLSISADKKSIERTSVNVIIRPVYTTADGVIAGTRTAENHEYAAVITGLPQTATYLTHTIFLCNYTCVRNAAGDIISLTVTSPEAADTTGLNTSGAVYTYNGVDLCKADLMQRTYNSTTYYGKSYKYVAAYSLANATLTADQIAFFEDVLSK